jgi:hypothetical protein
MANYGRAKMRYKFEKDKLYKVTFLDHCVGEHEVITCEVAGWLVSETPDHITLTYWLVVTDCEETRRDNLEPVNIIKSAIKKVRKLG